MRLVIHIGYPKTATTTLQGGMLRKLHEESRINYIGNAESSEDPRLKLVDRLVRQVFFVAGSGGGYYQALASGGPFLAGLLRADIPNVLSSEYFTIPGFGDYPAEAHPGMIRCAFGEVDYKVIMTTRNHPDLVNSFYAHFYEWARRYGDIAEIENGPPDIDGWTRKNILADGGPLRAGFDFCETERRWAAEFGERSFSVALFEDLRERPAAHFDVWASVLDIDITHLTQLHANAARRRVRHENAGAYSTSIPWGAERKMRRRGGPVQTARTLRFGEHMLAYIQRRLPARRVAVPRLSQEVRGMLRDCYSESTTRLLDRHGIERPKAEEFGYV